MRPAFTVAIDFDETFTADVEAWTEVIQSLQKYGHRVVCISARRNELSHQQELRKALPAGVDILLSYGTPKRLYAKSQGVLPDIWIDDMPEAIPSKQDMERMCG